MKQMQLRVTLYPSPQVTAPCIWQCCNGVAQRMELEILSKAGKVPHRVTQVLQVGQLKLRGPFQGVLDCVSFLENIFPPLNGGNTFVKAKFFIINLLFQLGSYGSQTHSYKHQRTPHQLSVLKHTLMDSCFSPPLWIHFRPTGLVCLLPMPLHNAYKIFHWLKDTIAVIWQAESSRGIMPLYCTSLLQINQVLQLPLKQYSLVSRPRTAGVNASHSPLLHHCVSSPELTKRNTAWLTLALMHMSYHTLITCNQLPSLATHISVTSIA